MTRALPAAALLAATLFSAASCGGPRCARIGYVKDGAPVEEGQAVFARAMAAAERENPLPPYAPEDPEAVKAAHAAIDRRMTTTDAIMRAEGWQRVELPVDCTTGAPLPE